MPWLTFSIFDIALSQVISFNVHKSFLEELKWNFLQIRGHGDQIWFVAALFVAFIPFYFFIQWYETESQKMNGGSTAQVAILLAWLLSFASVLYKRLTPASLFPWNSTSLPWHIEYMFQAMFYMTLGYIFHHNMERKFDEYNTPRMRETALIIYLILVYIPFVEKIKMPMIIDIMYQYVVSVVGIFTLILICKTVKTNRYINYVGQNTLIYFALHGKAYSVMQALLKRFMRNLYAMVLDNVVTSSLFCFVFALVLSVVLMVPTYIINRWCPGIMGRNSV